jgi:hypothetical protein
MGRIVACTNPLDPTDVQTFRHTGPFIDWLEQHYPAGFSGPHVAALNLTRLAVEDYDTVIGPQDVLSLAIMPGVPVAVFAGLGTFWSTVAAAAANAIIAVGLNYAINALFGPKAAAPTAPAATISTPTAGSVYSLSVPTNLARLGEPIPVCYGKNLVVPNQAMTPYSYYSTNDQYICQIMCIGQDEYTVHDIKVAESSTVELGTDVVYAAVWPASAHLKTFGTIQAATGIYENVYTSPEVTDLELYGDVGGVFITGVQTWNGAWPFGGDYPAAGMFMLDTEASEYAEAIRNGRAVYMAITNGGAADGTYQITYMMHSGSGDDPKPPELYRLGTISPAFWPATGHFTANLTYTPAGEGNVGAPVGPFAASPTCMLTEHLQYDLVLPNGCFMLDSTSGALLPYTVSITFVAALIDNDGAELGPWSTYVWTETMATNTPQRRTIDHAVPKGRYAVRAERGTPESDRGQDNSKTYWVGLKSILGPYCDSTVPVYGDVTLLAVRIKATEGISSTASDHISVSCTRKIDGIETRSPVDAFRDIYTNTVYGGRRPLTELDEAALAAVTAEVPDCVFDAIFDQGSTIWEALGLSVQMIRGIPIISGGLVSLVRDKPQCVPVAAFNEDRIAELTRSYLFNEVGDYDGLEGEYIDPLDGSKQYVMWPQTAENPESVTLWGCTSMARAQCFLQQFWLQRTLRRRLTTFKCELDSHAIEVGDPINITHRTLGAGPVMHVVSAIRPSDEFTAEVDAYIYEPGVFA